MQKVNVAKVSIKRGENRNGPWINTRVTSDTGVIFSTFHKGAQEIAEGDTVEMEVTVSEKGNNFDEYKILEKGSAPTADVPSNGGTPGGGAYKRDTEAIRLEYGLKAHLQAIERASIEAQTAYNGIMRLSSVPGVELTGDSAAAYEEAINWARLKMAATLANQGPSEVTGAKSGRGDAPAPGKAPASTEDKAPKAPSFPHVGALLKWCADNGVDRSTFLGIVGATEQDLPKINVEDAYQAVLQYQANRPDPNGNIPI